MKRQKVLIKDRPSCSRTEDEIDDEKFEEDRRRIQTSIRDKCNDEITIGKISSDVK